MRYSLDPTWWRRSSPAGETVSAGSPVRIFRFTSAATSFLDALEHGLDPGATTSGLESRLVAAGAIHPVPSIDGTPGMSMHQVTVVIPAHVTDTGCVRDLVSRLPEVGAVIVVDDGSPQPIDAVDGATVVRHDSARGPAAARNRALDLVTTEYVVFLDHDVVLPDEADSDVFWEPLLFHFRDPEVGIVAPRIMSAPGPSILERYEVEKSPLDLGDVPARVHPGSRVSYVPSAALLVRMSALHTLGGFDTELRFGEDVDLVWRAHAAGLVCRYEPMVRILHRPRSTWRDLIVQRYRYGTAAAELEARHPGSTRPLRINKWSAAVCALALAGHPVVASGLAASTVVRLSSRLAAVPDHRAVALRLAGRGHLHAARMIMETAFRTWWPVTLVAGTLSQRVRSLAALTVGYRILRRSANARRTSPDGPNPVVAVCLELADGVAYGTGVWAGAIERRDPACLRPRFD